MKVKDITYLRDEMIKIALYHKVNHEVAEDIVQDVFYKLCKIEQRDGNLDRITYKGEINMVYIFKMIGNAVKDRYKSEKRMVYVDNYFDEGGCIEQPSTLPGEVDRILQKEGRFYHRLYIAYFNDKISIRKLSKETGVGTQTIFQGIKYIKTKLRDII